MLSAPDKGKPHTCSTKSNSASDARLLGKMGHGYLHPACGYLHPAVAEHSPCNEVGQELLFCMERISTVLNLGLGKGKK